MEWACTVGKVRHVTSCEVGTHHILLLSLPRASLVQMAQLAKRYCCPVPVGMLLLAPRLTLAPLCIQ